MSFGGKTQRLGIHGYARLLRAVVTPAAPGKAAQSIGRMRSATASRLLCEFHRHGIVHITGWERSSVHPAACWMPVYKAGVGDDAQAPDNIKLPGRLLQAAALEFIRFTGILMDGPLTVQQLANEAGTARRPAEHYLRAMRASGLLYVAAWDTSGHRPTRMWAWGPGRQSAKRPASMAGVAREWSQHRQALRALQALRGQGCETMVAAKVAERVVAA